jgi:hypothetical protein
MPRKQDVPFPWWKSASLPPWTAGKPKTTYLCTEPPHPPIRQPLISSFLSPILIRERGEDVLRLSFSHIKIWRKASEKASDCLPTLFGWAVERPTRKGQERNLVGYSPSSPPPYPFPTLWVGKGRVRRRGEEASEALGPLKSPRSLP